MYGIADAAISKSGSSCLIRPSETAIDISVTETSLRMVSLCLFRAKNSCPMMSPTTITSPSAQKRAIASFTSSWNPSTSLISLPLFSSNSRRERKTSSLFRVHIAWRNLPNLGATSGCSDAVWPASRMVSSAVSVEKRIFPACMSLWIKLSRRNIFMFIENTVFARFFLVSSIFPATFIPISFVEETRSFAELTRPSETSDMPSSSVEKKLEIVLPLASSRRARRGTTDPRRRPGI
mmetsp:Transcript_6367/g.8863  ORF Transcript_6367/g.8863 Transcript_6367/m.8863 type:complete len:236 (-) Transcript_6367:130-837(-)